MAGCQGDRDVRVPDGFGDDSVRNQHESDAAEKNVRGSDGFGPGSVRNPHAPSGSRPRPSARRLALFALVAAAVVALDQLSKAAARAALVPGEPVTLIPGVMDLSLVFNTGAAFSLGEGAGPVFVLVVAAILALGVWVAAFRTEVPLPIALVLGAVAGGGVGNAIDRVALGAVTDFFKTTFVDFAIFNVADIFVTCGVVVALVLFWRWDAERERAAGEGR